MNRPNTMHGTDGREEGRKKNKEKNGQPFKQMCLCQTINSSLLWSKARQGFFFAWDEENWLALLTSH